MNRRTFLTLSLVFAGFVSIALAEDKPDPTGTWKWTAMIQNQSRDMTLKLKLDGEKLTGKILGRNNQETSIEDATFKDGEVAFSVTRERNGQKNTTTYKGKLEGDSIKGKSERTRNGQSQSLDWEAKREKA